MMADFFDTVGTNPVVPIQVMRIYDYLFRSWQGAKLQENHGLVDRILEELQKIEKRYPGISPTPEA